MAKNIGILHKAKTLDQRGIYLFLANLQKPFSARLIYSSTHENKSTQNFSLKKEYFYFLTL